MGSATTLTLSFTLTPYKSTAFTTRRTSTNTTISALFLSPIQASHHGPCYWECKKGLKFAFSSKTNWVQIVSPKQYEDDEFVVVNFYRFVYIEDLEKEVSKHLSFLQGRDIHGRIYLNEQGINAQYSGPYKDVIAYVTWLKEDNRFSDILVQISLSFSGHAFPRIKMRYKPSLVQAFANADGNIRYAPSQWKREVRKWYPTFHVEILHDSAQALLRGRSKLNMMKVIMKTEMQN